MRNPRISTALAALALATAAAVSPAGPASADTVASENPPVVLAVDTTPAPATVPASVIGIDANIINGLTVTGHDGKAVTATAKGKPTRTAKAPAGKPAILRNLTPGTTYAIAIGGRRIGTAVPVAQVGAASGLRVQTTSVRGSVEVAWDHTATRGEGVTVSYDVVATPLTADGTDAPGAVRATVRTMPATLSGLRTDARYRFTVTPKNTASTGRASTALMTRTLAELTGTVPAPAKPEPTTPPAPPAPAAPAPAPAGPSTHTIYVCPSGYIDAGDTCTDTKAYTFHTETVTLAYTFHNGVIGSHIVHHPGTGSCSYLPNPNSPTGLDIYCPPGWDETVQDYGIVKDATPTSYTDNGTAWVKDVQIKDTAPAGYADSGTAWVKTVGKIAQVVPA